MKVTKENKDNLNAVISIKVEKSDYEPKVNESLKEYRKKAKLDGFRTGKVPMGLVKKMYGKSVMLDEVNKIISEGIQNFINDEELDILGDPIPNEDHEKIDFDKDEEFEFKFDLGLKPEMDISLDKRLKQQIYKIKADDKLIDEYIENYARNYGETVDSEKSDEESYIDAAVSELNKDNDIAENGIKNENAKIAVSLSKDDEIKSKLVGLKIGDIVDIDLWKAFPNDVEISGLLGIEKDQAEAVKGKNFRIEVKNIQSFKEAEVDQNLFDKVFGEGTVRTIDEFRDKIKEQAEVNLSYESDYKFNIDIKDKLVKKVDPELPEEFLKRWLSSSDNKMKKEDIERDWEQISEDIKWQLISGKVAEQEKIELEEEDLLNGAKAYISEQFRQYGMSYIPDEQLQQYAVELLKKDEERRKVYDRQLQTKVLKHIRENIKLEEKEISLEKFKALLSK